MKNLINKHLLFALMLTLFTSTATYAQSHLTFMGIPINGTLKDFQKKLNEKGIPTKRTGKNTLMHSMELCVLKKNFKPIYINNLPFNNLMALSNEKTKMIGEVILISDSPTQQNLDDEYYKHFENFRKEIEQKYKTEIVSDQKSVNAYGRGLEMRIYDINGNELGTICIGLGKAEQDKEYTIGNNTSFNIGIPMTSASIGVGNGNKESTITHEIHYMLTITYRDSKNYSNQFRELSL